METAPCLKKTEDKVSDALMSFKPSLKCLSILGRKVLRLGHEQFIRHAKISRRVKNATFSKQRAKRQGSAGEKKMANYATFHLV